jgi:hypothetical protein
MKTLTKEQIWWKQLGSHIKTVFQRRHYPATNWEWLTDEQVKDIYNKEKQLTNENK